VLEALAAADVEPLVRTLAIPDRLIEHGSTLASVGLDADAIVRAVAELVRGRGARS
jgi:deoxyxylulose-5-phosphate synthase